MQEEDCDGLCWQYIINEDGLTPEAVVIAEPTNLGVYRGHRGRMEIEVRTQGVSCHGSAPERGVNAVYKMAPIVADIERLNDRLGGEPFLGKGTVTIAAIRSDVAVAVRGRGLGRPSISTAASRPPTPSSRRSARSRACPV